MGTILSVVESVLTNLGSDEVWQRYLKGVEDRRLKAFAAETSEWVQAFLNEQDGTVLTSGRFAAFLDNYHSIESTIQHICVNEEAISKEDFLNRQLELFHASGREKQTQSYMDDQLVRGFLEKLYGRIEAFYHSLLTTSEQYILAKSREGGARIEAGLHEQERTLSEIRELLKKKNEIEDKATVVSLYQRLSARIWEGNLQEVSNLLPLLEGKSRDLELGIRYLLSLMSEDSFAVSYGDIQSQMQSDEIFSDLVRKTIYAAWIGNKPELLQEIGTRNPTLHFIAHSILAQDFTLFLKVDQQPSGYEFTFMKPFPEEEWLVSRIWFLQIANSPVSNASEMMPQILCTPIGILDEIVLFYRTAGEVVNYQRWDLEKARKLLGQYEHLEKWGPQLKPEFQSLYFVAGIRLEKMISPQKVRQTLSRLPKALCQREEIKILEMEVAVSEGTAAFQDILDFCGKTNQYWLLNNYFVGIVGERPQMVLDLVEEHRFLLKKNVGILLAYVQAVYRLCGKQSAAQELEGFSEQYGSWLDYWVLYNRVLGITEEKLMQLVQKWKNGELSCQYDGVADDFLKILLEMGKHEDVIQLLDMAHAPNAESAERRIIRGHALMGLGREIDALDCFLAAFHPEKLDAGVIDCVMLLSLNNKRAVPEEVYQAARNSDSARLLMLAAGCAQQKGDHSGAKELLEKALLQDSGGTPGLYERYIGLSLSEKASRHADPQWVEEGTAVYLYHADTNQEMVYCVHGSRILPREPFSWGGAVHIYRESAIKEGFFRKKVGDSVVLDGGTFLVRSIKLMDTFFSSVCMDRLLQNGGAKQLPLLVDPGGNADLETFYKELNEILGDTSAADDWIRQYEDLDALILPLYVYHRFTRVTYSQLVAALLEEPGTIFRSCFPSEEAAEKYLLSFSAIVALQKMGFPVCQAGLPVYLTESQYRTIQADKETIIAENSRENLMALKFWDGRPLLIESSEEQKQKQMKQAVELEEFAGQFSRVSNTSDMVLNTTPSFDLKTLLGIGDYDAFRLAQTEGYTLVAAEAPVAMLANDPKIGIHAVSVSDFVAAMCADADSLLRCIRRMFEFRFQIPVTLPVVLELSAFYEKAGVEERESILTQWGDILEIPFADSRYREVVAELFQKLFLTLADREERITPVLTWFVIYTMKYHKMHLRWIVSENGSPEPELVSEEHP